MTSSTSILVNVDQTAPLLSIESPQDQSLISRSKIDIRGTVNDAVEGLFQAPQPTLSVQVNGKVIEAATQVTDKQFLIKDLPLQTGPNRIVITASDMHGNQRSASILVLRNFVGSSRITLLSGDQQSGLIGEKLAQPLKIVALDENGSPLAKQAINVDVIRGSGSISDSASQEHKANGLTPSRNLKLMTDNNGELQVWHRLGTQAGPAANAIRFSHPSIPEEAIFTATSQPGPVAILNGDTGLFQNVQTQSQPLELLTAVVRDKALNPLSGVAVEFFVKTGQAYFAPEEGVMIADMNGKTGQKITLKTDKNGLVAVRPYIGEEEGLVEIQAKLATIASIGGSANNASNTNNATNTANPVLADVIYKLQAKAAKDGPTGFSGRVFDDKGLPIAGVTLSIARTLNSTTTDAKGQFNFSDIPAGRIDLFVDGRTVNPNLDSGKPQYPSLHFEAYAVQGQANSLTHPIYMPPLRITPQSAKLVGAQDTTLTLPNLAGFSMFIKKGSVTFPDGSKTGQLIVSPVTADRLPMSPPSGGALFGLPAWTIQPAGTRFDPPIEVRMPNNTALPPGSRTPVIQWDHDLGQYTAMGYATVSEDGSQLITEAGSGISKAGWGGGCIYFAGATASGGGPPPPPCPPMENKKCSFCQKISIVKGTCPSNTCEWDPKKDGLINDQYVTLNGKFAFEAPISKIIQKAGSAFGVTVTVNVSGSSSYSLSADCCYLKKKSDSPNTSGDFSANGEFSAAIPLMPLMKKISTVDVLGFLGSVTPTASFGLGFSGAASGSYRECDDKGEAGGKLSLTATLAVGLGQPVFTAKRLRNNKGTVNEEVGNLTPLQIGVAGSGEIVIKTMTKTSFLSDWSAKFIIFAKSGFTVGSFNVEILDINYPIWLDQGRVEFIKK